MQKSLNSEQIRELMERNGIREEHLHGSVTLEEDARSELTDLIKTIRHLEGLIIEHFNQVFNP